MADIQKITDALKMLDHTNADHWTDDGLPRTSIVQKLASDLSIKRGDIQSAAPNFVRKTPTDIEGIALGDGGPKALASEVAAAAEAPTLTFDAQATEGEGEQMTEEEVKVILDQNVRSADQALLNAVANVSEGQRIVREAQKAVTKARDDRQSAFPPISASENIKQHLARQQARMMEARGGPARIDQAMAHGNSRGWGRPTRQFTMPDGRVVTAGPRTQHTRKTPDLYNKRPAARV
jgi:hypothetical protein